MPLLIFKQNKMQDKACKSTILLKQIAKKENIWLKSSNILQSRLTKV